LNSLFELCRFIPLERFRGDLIWAAGSVLRRYRDLTAPATGLRLPPFQVFTQRIAQPVLTGDGAVIRALIWFVGHDVLCSNRFAKFDPIMFLPAKRRRPTHMHWRRCRNKPWPDGEVDSTILSRRTIFPSKINFILR
jgi:hypothetical protein